MTQIEAYITEHRERFIEDLKAWICIPSISTQPEYKQDTQRAAEYAVDQLKKAGITHTELIQTKGHPLVYGEWQQASGKPTVLIYGHYDVQPVDPIDEWETPPFEPDIRGGNIYGRGTADDKGQVMLIFKALETISQVEKAFPVNIKLLLEGEEECGGSSIETYVRTHPERLDCDAVLICDTHMPAENQPAFIIGLRGITYTELEVRGAEQDLHSGTYGGIAPNPLHALAIIISRLKDAEGHIHIPGLYDKLRKPLPGELDFWQQDPLGLNEAYKKEMGITELVGEAEYPPIERVTARPTLEVHGISGGFVGEGAKTVIPASARAKISLRLPPDLKSDEIFTLLEQAVRNATPTGVQVTLHNLHGGEGAIFSPDGLPLRAAAQALEETYGKPPIPLREGGSIPVAALFDEILHAPVVLMGFGLPDDRLHSPNEKFSLNQFFNGIRTTIKFLHNLAE